ncbi:MAG: hypothetical protein RLZZ423_1621 [Cyanobacteriota bacterium]|jgi:hypothetical protein
MLLRVNASMQAQVMEQGGSDSPMLVLISGILLLGAIAAFIAWGLANAYPAA